MSKSKYISIGTSGTDIAGRRFDEEYLNKLLDTQAADVWDEMRRSDDQVTMLLNSVKNPIMSARWFVEPTEDTPEATEIADFVSHVIFKDMGTKQFPKTFEKFKREALTCLEFGYSVFELTNKIVFEHPTWGNYIGIKGLDWRSPRTIEEWYVSRSGVLEQIRQIDNSENGGDFFIPGDFILHIAPNMEGDNFEGISILRPIYGNWLRKSFYRKIQMIGVERAATGIPIGEIPRGQENSTSQKVLEDSLSKFVTHERAYMTVPEGYNINSLKIEHDAEKVQSAIAAEDKGMAKAFLANFMELGLSGSGSFALGTDLSDIFLSGIEVYSNAVLAPINSKLIPNIVKSKFGEQEKYPEMKIEGINDKAGKEFAEVLGLLDDHGLVQKDKRLKSVIHKRYNLPEFQEEQEDQIVSPEINENSLQMDESQIQTVIFDKSRFDTNSALNWLKEHGLKFDKEDETADFLRYRQEDPEQFDRLRTKNITQGVTFVIGFKDDMSFPEPEQNMLSLAEPNLSSTIKKTSDELLDIMKKELQSRSNLLIADILKIWRNTEKSKRMEKVNRLSVPRKNEYKKKISNFLAEVNIRSTKGVVSELGLDNVRFAENTKKEFAKLPPETKSTAKSQSELLVETQDADLKKNLFFTFTANADTLPAEPQIEASLRKSAEDYVKGPAVSAAAVNVIANTVNLARNSIYQKPEVLERIESFIFVNPSPVAPICQELKGRVFTKEEYLTTDKLPPLHHKCNSWIKAQVAGKAGNKKLTPIGLAVTGTERQIEQKLRSKKF